MKKQVIGGPDLIRFALQQQVGCSDDTRYVHRLHAILLVSSGVSCQQVAELLGEDRRTLQRWVRRFEADGLEGLREGEHPGRPSTLTERQWEKLKRDLSRRPKSMGVVLFRWDGKLLAAHLQEKYGVTLGLRQCQRILRESRERRPGPAR
jgi:transposase